MSRHGRRAGVQLRRWIRTIHPQILISRLNPMVDPEFPFPTPTRDGHKLSAGGNHPFQSLNFLGALELRVCERAVLHVVVYVMFQLFPDFEFRRFCQFPASSVLTGMSKRAIFHVPTISPFGLKTTYPAKLVPGTISTFLLSSLNSFSCGNAILVVGHGRAASRRAWSSS